MNHRQDVHIAYEKLVSALDNYIKVYTQDPTACPTDWLLITAFENNEPMRVGYTMPTSYSAPHILLGLLDEASSILSSEQFDRREHERGDCTCDESD